MQDANVADMDRKSFGIHGGEKRRIGSNDGGRRTEVLSTGRGLIVCDDGLDQHQASCEKVGCGEGEANNRRPRIVHLENMKVHTGESAADTLVDQKQFFT